jgi:pimeloyl-ACP methyl ester carboxylesterase
VTEITYCGSDGCSLYATVVEAVGTSTAGGDRPVVVLMHGGGPDHRSLIPLAQHLADLSTVVLPDVRGYGRSVCPDPARHTWGQYAADVVALLDRLGVRQAVVGGAGLGGTIAMRAAVAYPDRVRALVLVSVEDIEDDEKKAAEVAFMDAFAARVRAEGIEAAWKPILPDLAPVIGAMVREAIPRSDPASVAAAAAATARSAASRNLRSSPRRHWSSPASTTGIRPRSRSNSPASCRTGTSLPWRSRPTSTRPTTSPASSPRRSEASSSTSWPTVEADIAGPPLTSAFPLIV